MRHKAAAIPTICTPQGSVDAAEEAAHFLAMLIFVRGLLFHLLLQGEQFFLFRKRSQTNVVSDVVFFLGRIGI